MRYPVRMRSCNLQSRQGCATALRARSSCSPRGARRRWHGAGDSGSRGLLRLPKVSKPKPAHGSCREHPRGRASCTWRRMQGSKRSNLALSLASTASMALLESHLAQYQATLPRGANPLRCLNDLSIDLPPQLILHTDCGLQESHICLPSLLRGIENKPVLLSGSSAKTFHAMQSCHYVCSSVACCFIQLAAVHIHGP